MIRIGGQTREVVGSLRRGQRLLGTAADRHVVLTRPTHRLPAQAHAAARNVAGLQTRRLIGTSRLCVASLR